MLLAPVAVFQATAPLRTEYALQHASLQELQVKAQVDPDNLQTQLYLARRASLEQQYPVASAAYQKVAAADKSNDALWIEWANAAAGSGNIPVATGILKTFAQDNPTNAPCHVALGEIYLEGGSPGQALQEAETTAKLDPNLADALILKGQAIDASTDDHVQARALIAKAEAMAPNNWRAYQAMGDVEIAQSSLDKAVADYQHAVDLNPESGVPYERLGKALLTAEATSAQLDEAQKSFEKAASLAGSLPRDERFQTYLGLGQIGEEEGRWSDAANWLRQAVSVRPEHLAVHYELAQVYREEGDSADAEKEQQIHEMLYQRTLEGVRLTYRLQTVPNDLKTRLQLARLYASYNDYHHAQEQYEYLLHQNPDDKVAKQELAAIQQKMEPAQEARTTP